MIFYGYASDEMLAEIHQEAIEDMKRKNGVMLHTCYSVGAYEPEASILGVELDSRSSLFSPVAVKDLRLEPTEEEIAAVKSVYDRLTDDQKTYFDAEPSVYFFETTDD